MNKKLLHLPALALMFIVALTSCNRDMPEFASGRFRHNEKDVKNTASAMAFRQRQHAQPIALREQEAIKNECNNETLTAVPVKEYTPHHNIGRLFHKKVAKGAVQYESDKSIVSDETVLKADFSKQNNEKVKTHHKFGLFHNGDRLLCAIICIFIPFLGVGLYEGLSVNFWIDLILTLLFYVPGLVFGLIVILSN